MARAAARRRAVRPGRSPAATPRRGGPRPRAAANGTRGAIFAAAATAFARRGFDGVGVEDIARAAGVNKAMIYYHFAGKLALYRAIVCAMLDDLGAAAAAIVSGGESAADKLDAFIDALAARAEARPYFPPLMIREMADGAPRLDARTLTRMRTVFSSFARILEEGVAEGRFRPVSPLLAYLTVVGPLVLNAARERAGSGRHQWPMFVAISHADLTRHLHLVGRRLLQKD